MMSPPAFRFSTAVMLCVLSWPAAGLLGADRLIENQGFTLQVPSDWEEVRPESPRALITARSARRSDEDRFRENIQLFVYRIGKQLTPEEVLKRQKSDTGRFRLVAEGTVPDATESMTWMAITPKVPRDESDRLMKIDFITTHGDSIVVVTAMDEVEHWKEHFPTLRGIAASLTHPK